MELKDYTTEELREELKRRYKEARQKIIRERPKYIEIEGLVVDRQPCYYNRSYLFIDFKLKIDDERVPYPFNLCNYKIKNGCFKKSTIPKIGDTVIISHRLTNARNKFNHREAKIVKIVKHKEE